MTGETQEGTSDPLSQIHGVEGFHKAVEEYERVGAQHPPLLYIEWIDAADVSARWQDRSDVQKAPEAQGQPLATTGFLIRETDDWLVLSAMVRGQMDQMACSFMVPKATVMYREQLREAVGYDFEETS